MGPGGEGESFDDLERVRRKRGTKKRTLSMGRGATVTAKNMSMMSHFRLKGKA